MTRGALKPLLISILLISGCGGHSTAKEQHRSHGVPGSQTTTTLLAPSDPTSSSPTSPTSWWRPTAGLSWQWQLDGERIDTTLDVDVFDLDAQTTSPDVVADLHAKGKKVICYVDVGTFERDRPDAADFPPSLLGKVVDGWPDERWLDIRGLDAPTGPTGLSLRQILERRIDVCRAKGFDALEPDWMDGYAHDTGFALSGEDQLRFNRVIAQMAHDRGLAVGLKNDKEQTAQLVSEFEFGVDEECQKWNECNGGGRHNDPGWKPFIDAGTPVFNAEYSDQLDSCRKINGLSSILKNRDLDAWRKACES